MTQEERDELIAEFMEEAEALARSEYRGTLPEEDLVQEGYMGILQGIALLEAEDPDRALSVSETIRESIRGAICAALARERDMRMDDDRLVVQVELLGKSISRLTEELGEKPNVDELANDLGISQEEVLKIIKLTGTTPDEENFYENPGTQ